MTDPASLPVWRYWLIGALGGFLAGMFGVGGGVLMVPLLIVAGGLDQRRAAATSLLAIMPTALVGTVSYAIEGEVSWGTAGIVAVGGIVGSWLGARLLRLARLSVLHWSFVALLVTMTVVVTVWTPQRAAPISLSAGSAVTMVALGVAMGLAAALFGIGGGIIAVPALMVLLGAGDLTARGTSLAIMIPTALTGSAKNLRARLVDPRAGGSVGLAAALASWGGSQAAGLVSPRAGNLMFAALLVIAAAQLTNRALRGRR
jgi:uncharacterized membrane protein YfcA